MRLQRSQGERHLMRSRVHFAWLACLPLLAQQPHVRTKPADTEELGAITARGRAIAAYDAAAWHATDAVQALHPAKDAVRMYIGRYTSGGWEIAFGKLNDTRDAFLLAYDAEPTGDKSQPKISANPVPIAERDDWLNIARAFDLARAQMKLSRPYNGAVLAGPDGDWYVYFYPAQTTTDSFPTGADTRFLVSHDGTKILDTHPMHISLLENQMPKDGKVQMSFHTAVLDDAPEDTDVADTLMMGGIPMLIACKNFTYQVQADGKIISLGRTEDFLKDVKK